MGGSEGPFGSIMFHRGARSFSQTVLLGWQICFLVARVFALLITRWRVVSLLTVTSSREANL